MDATLNENTVTIYCSELIAFEKLSIGVEFFMLLGRILECSVRGVLFEVVSMESSIFLCASWPQSTQCPVVLET